MGDGWCVTFTSRMECNTLLSRKFFATVFACNCVVVFLAIFASDGAFAPFSVTGAGQAHGSIRSGLHSLDPLWNSLPWGRSAAATFLIWWWWLHLWRRVSAFFG